MAKFTQSRDFWTSRENGSTRTNPLKYWAGSTSDPTPFYKREFFFFVNIKMSFFIYLFEGNIHILLISLGGKKIK